MDIATIGFTKSSARSFFTRLKEAGLPTLVDVRLHNTSQLAAFAKREDLEYFLEGLCGMRYVEEPLLAPEAGMLAAYRAGTFDWKQYERRYRRLLTTRRVDSAIDRAALEPGAVFLCSEDRPEHCHRRLAAEYLAKHWDGVHIRHL